jgi:lipoyl(octanoyl) transferase
MNMSRIPQLETSVLDWRIAPAPVPYADALQEMDNRVAAIKSQGAADIVWLLEHPPLYTAGTSAQAEDLLHPRFPVFVAGRGGQYTYHGPGQRVAYVMMDLQRRGVADVRRFVHDLEEWMIVTLRTFGLQGGRREGRVGIWIDMEKLGRGRQTGGAAESKIAAIGVRVRKWVTFHGISLNVSPDLSHYNGIVPCGLRQYGVTSLHDLGIDVPMDEVDRALRQGFKDVFGV